MQTKANLHRKDNTRLPGIMWLLTDHLPIGISATMPWTLINLMRLLTRGSTWVNFLSLIRPQAGMFSICRQIRRPQPYVSFSISIQQSPVSKMLNVTMNGHAHPTPWPYPGHSRGHVAYLCRDHSHHRSCAWHQRRRARVRPGYDDFQRQYRARGCPWRRAHLARIKQCVSRFPGIELVPMPTSASAQTAVPSGLVDWRSEELARFPT